MSGNKLLSHLNQIDQMQKIFLGILLTFGGELRMTSTNQSFEHLRLDTFLILQTNTQSVELPSNVKGIFITQ